MEEPAMTDGGLNALVTSAAAGDETAWDALVERYADADPGDNLLRALDDAVRTPDPTPPAVLDAARAVYTWRSVDAVTGRPAR
jgi:hypothetical protein